METKTIEQIYKELNTSAEGLSSSEAASRIEKYGKNELKTKKKTPWWVAFLKEFADLMVIILIIAAVFAYFAGDTRDAVVIFFIVLLNAIIGYIQEYKAEKAIEALKKMMAPNARVIRGGKEIEINAKLLVPGDIIVLQEGDKITADARVIEENELETQEATLTGESTPVSKHSEPGDPSNLIYMGTDVAHGSGKAVVISTGMQTKFGNIAKLTTQTKKDKTPLEKELFKLGMFVGKITLVISAILIAVGIFIQGQDIIYAFIFAASVAVAAVPEGLPATVTIALAFGVQRLAKKKSIIRQLSSVETLGSTTHICTDKTGTLTKNEMTVKKVYLNEYDAQVGGVGYMPWGAVLFKSKTKHHFLIGDIDSQEEEFEKRKTQLEKIKADEKSLYDSLEMLGTICNLCNNAALTPEENENHERVYTMLGDPTEGALLTFAQKIGFNPDETKEKYKKLHELAFDSDRKRMSVIMKDNKTEKNYVFTKGAPDALLEISKKIMINGRIINLDEETKKKILEKNENMAKQALRVIGFAYKEIENKDHFSIKEDESDLVFVGLVGMIDPPRRDIKRAIVLAKKAGIKVYIVTGDQGLTAEAIAKQIGLVNHGGHEIITGKDLAAMKDEDLIKIFKDQEKEVIFARTSPEDKLRIVSLLKSLDHVVAVTGDGVNDAPALKRADIGIAMGLTGTDVSKEASNMILADDSFSTIITAVQEGRTIYENLKKFVFYIFSCNTGELIVVFSAVVFAIPAPLTAILILCVDLGTDVLPALALGVDPPEKGIMELPPRSPKAKIMDRAFIGRFLYLGLFIGAIVVGTYFWSLFEQGWHWGEPLAVTDTMHIKSSTFAFAILVLIQMVNAYNSRSSVRSVFQMGFFNNLWLLGSVAISVATVYMLVEVPFFNTWIHTAPLAWYEWLVIIVGSFAILVVEEIRKLVVRLRMRTVKS